MDEVLGNLEAFQGESGWEIFNPRVMKMLGQLSKEILGDKTAKNFPDLMSVGFAIRPTSLERYRNMFLHGSPRKGRGKTFHITPANVPLNFVFSYVFALLAGNPSCVRLSSKNFPQVEVFIQILLKVLNDVEFEFIRKSTYFIRYPHNQKITDYFSSTCDARIIWGGDSTIKQIKKSEIPLRAIDIAFSDRYSFSLLNAEVILETDEQHLDEMVEKFFSDAYLFDQRGCSSPKLVCWTGTEQQVITASQIFWGKVRLLANSRYDLQVKNSVDKFVDACIIASSDCSINEIDMSDNFLLVMDSNLDSRLIGEFHGQFGSFLQCRFTDLSDLQMIVNGKFQTMTYFGYSIDSLRDLVLGMPLKGIDRVVPVGQAFDISINWDGVNFVETLSRIIEFK
jgi:hypothetical protein